MTDRKREEAKFHDHLRDDAPFQAYSVEAEDRLKGNKEWSNFRWYSIEQESREYVNSRLLSCAPGSRVLDYGCGNGDTALFVAEHGGFGVGIDISEVSVQNCRDRAAAAGLSQSTEFRVMDAEAMDYPDDWFDVVVVYGVLHHLDFDAAMSEIARVLKPTGWAICTEALAHNPLIHAYRKATPKLRTDWEVEHIMRRRNIVRARRWFGRVDTRFYHLATLGAVPFRRRRSFGAVLGVMQRVDSLLLAMPGVRWLSWQIVFELSEPLPG